MDGFDIGDMLGSLFGGAVEGAGVADTAAGLLGGLFGGQPRQSEVVQPITYERYLCGGPKHLNINDR